MPKELEIAQEAICDLEEIWDYIAKDSPGNADRFVDQIYRKCAEIADLDGIGRSRDELIPGIFSILHKRYVVFFQRDELRVRIVRILHGARDLGSALEED